MRRTAWILLALVCTIAFAMGVNKAERRQEERRAAERARKRAAVAAMARAAKEEVKAKTKGLRLEMDYRATSRSLSLGLPRLVREMKEETPVE